MRISVAILATALAGPTFASPADDATSAAKAWLALVDKSEYAQSWNAASPLFESQLTTAKWAKVASAVRGPLGTVVARQLTTLQLRRSLPGVPDGNYAVIRYRTQFAHKASAFETVTMQDDHGTWKAAGYFIR